MSRSKSEVQAIERELNATRTAIASDFDALDARLQQMSPKAILARHSATIIAGIAAAGLIVGYNRKKSLGPLALAAVTGVAVWYGLRRLLPEDRTSADRY